MSRESGRCKRYYAAVCERYVKLKQGVEEQGAKPQALTSSLASSACGTLAAEAQTPSLLQAT